MPDNVDLGKKKTEEKKWDPLNHEQTQQFEARLMSAPTGLPAPGTAYADFLRRRFGTPK